MLYIRVILGLYRDNGKENENYYMIIRHILGYLFGVIWGQWKGKWKLQYYNRVYIGAIVHLK